MPRQVLPTALNQRYEAKSHKNLLLAQLCDPIQTFDSDNGSRKS